MRDFVRDLRYAARILLRSPVATSVAVLALALGIGVNAAALIGISSLILHPLPYPRLERIVTIWGTAPKVHSERTPLTAADFTDLRKAAHSFDKLAGYRTWDVNLTGAGNPEHVQAFQVSADFFSVLGSSAARGRTFASENELSHPRAVVVSQGFWKSHLAGSPAAVGASISLSGQAYTVIGVMPDQFDFPLGTEVWSTLILDRQEQQDRNTRNLMVLGLLKPRVPPSEARAELTAIGLRLGHQYPRADEGRTIVAVPLGELTDQVTNHFLLTLLGAAGFVLLLACANIGNLQLARAAQREKEMAVRVALGASRFRVTRQLVAESVLISVVAGGLGLVAASWNNDYAKSSIPEVAMRQVPGLRTMQVDSTVVVLTLVVSLLAGLLCSAPAIAQVVHRKMRADLNDVLRGRGGSSPARSRLRSVLTVFELAIALVLLVGAGLMVKTFDRLLYLNQGFDPTNVLTMKVSLPAAEYARATQLTAFYDRVLQGFATIHGVQAAGLSSPLGEGDGLSIEGRPELRPGEPRPEINAISGRYLEAMRIPLLKGRSISAGDRADSPYVAVISATMARYYWPHANPLGRKIRLSAQSPWLTIVGVCGDVIEDWFSGLPSPAAYLSYAQFPNSSASLVLRTSGAPLQWAAPVRRQIGKVDKNLPVYELQTMQETIAQSRSGVQAAAHAMTTYAVIALLLAATGIYGVISYFVESRTHDIGVRMALGASRSQVVEMTLRQTARLVATGLVIGVPLAIVLTRIMSSALDNVLDLNPATFLLFAGVLTLCALLASYLPARRATRIDPVSALRND
ncbi:MAG TPA: ABC transporter permease [Bryobacteraceae bacterium]